MYARKRDRVIRNRVSSGIKGSPEDYIIKELEKIDEGLLLYLYIILVNILKWFKSYFLSLNLA